MLPHCTLRGTCAPVEKGRPPPCHSPPSEAMLRNLLWEMDIERRWRRLRIRKEIMAMRRMMARGMQTPRPTFAPVQMAFLDGFATGEGLLVWRAGLAVGVVDEVDVEAEVLDGVEIASILEVLVVLVSVVVVSGLVTVSHDTGSIVSGG
jgi:hypothetical protein